MKVADSLIGVVVWASRWRRLHLNSDTPGSGQTRVHSTLTVIVPWLVLGGLFSLSPNALAVAPERIERTAQLSVSAKGSVITATVDIQWTDDQPLQLSYYDRDSGPAIWAAIEYRDAQGHNATFWAVALPQAPSADRKLRRGDHWRACLESEASLQALHSGRYCATAKFTGTSGGHPVQFKTNECWFDVTVSPPRVAVAHDRHHIAIAVRLWPRRNPTLEVRPRRSSGASRT